MSEKTDAEAGAKVTAEELIAAQVTVAKAREKAIKKEAEEAAEASAKTTAEGLATAATAAATAAAKAAAKAEVEAKTIATLESELAVKKAASVKANQELAETNAKIVSLGLRFLGAYDKNVTYVPNDIVTENKKSYLFILTSKNAAKVTIEVTEGTAVLRGTV